MKLDIVKQTGEAAGTVELSEKVFGGVPNQSLLWEVARMYLANRRQGTAKAKRRGEVSGGGKKPWRQKHTGRARAGSTRSPVWKGGGVVFGPQPRDYSYTMPKKKKTLALASALAEKCRANLVKCVDDIILAEPKTKEVSAILKSLKLGGEKILLAVGGLDENLKRATRNIPRLVVLPAQDINAYDVMTNRWLVLTKKGLETLEARWQ